MSEKPRKPIGSYLLISFHIFLGIGALYGGGLLIISPDGSMLSLPPEIIETTPFNNYLIPGIILFAGLGLLPLFTAAFLITKKRLNILENLKLDKRAHWAWNSSLYIGFILIIWITVQMYILQVIVIGQISFVFLGLIIQAITLLPSVKNYYLIGN